MRNDVIEISSDDSTEVESKDQDDNVSVMEVDIGDDASEIEIEIPDDVSVVGINIPDDASIMEVESHDEDGQERRRHGGQEDGVAERRDLGTASSSNARRTDFLVVLRLPGSISSS
ncbi:hypothetical protein H0G86_010876 [Trichoderma simmonsii]|uniref:Uncharacterized protein n=1 Tax=Trichoderma simmonsii TaxID=1491479 RepID=A0A8G0LMB6_9HYPO|nr:hypothetical protein H0G86_010876 [Trichoderma simmonsii]